MSEQLKKFQAEFRGLEKKVIDYYGNRHSTSQTREHLTPQLLSCAEKIGSVVQDLKSKGKTGSKLKDFIDQKEVKSLYAIGQKLLSTLKDNDARESKQLDDVRKVVADINGLKQLVEKEVADRKKKVALSFSVPEMVKMAKVIEDFLKKKSKDGTSLAMIAAKKHPPFKWDKVFERDIEDEIAKTKDDAKAAMAIQMAGSTLSPRHVIAQSARFNKLKSVVDKLLTTKPVNVATAKKGVDEMAKVLEPLSEAYKAVKENYDKDPRAKTTIAKIVDMQKSLDATRKAIAAVK